jgi:hypothetical protein
VVTSYEKTLSNEKLARRPGAARRTSVAGVTAEATPRGYNGAETLILRHMYCLAADGAAGW